MTLPELVAALERLQTQPDREEAHVDADLLLVEYIGDGAVRHAYAAIQKGYA